MMTEYVEILTLMRFDEREVLLPVGLASIDEEDPGRPLMKLQLSCLDQRLFLPLWDLLALVGVDPHVISRYLRRRAARRARVNLSRLPIRGEG